MSKLKSTQRGKAGKHRSQDTIASAKVRAHRIVRTVNRADLVLIGLLRTPTNEPSGLLAGRDEWDGYTRNNP
jgi:hypothetical protein